MQFQIQELEFDMSRTEDMESQIEALKKDIQIRDRTIEARDKDLASAWKQVEEAHAQVLESEKTLDRVLTNLSEANEAKAALTARVVEVQSERDSLAADKQALSEKQKEAHARYKKLWKKSHHYKSKSKHLKKQLALVPWLRGLSWGRGSN
jgi:chromosome segregation ATPase